MRVNVDDVAFMDRRFKLLGGRLGMTWQEALGRCLPVWALAYSRRSTVLPAGDVDALAVRPGFAAAMMEVELAADQGDGVYLCGVAERIDFLLLQDAKRAKARQARLTAAGVDLPVGRSRGTRAGSGEVSRGKVPGDVPGEGPYSPDLTPDLTLTLEERSRPPGGGSPGKMEAAAPAQSFADRDLAKARAIGSLAEVTWQRLSELRMQHAAKLRLEGVLPLVVITPGTDVAAFRDLRQRIREEGDHAREVCDHVLRVLDEQATDTKAIEWLSEKAFLERPWRKARETTLKPKRKPAQPAPERHPVIAPEDRAGGAELAEAWRALGISGGEP